MTPTVSAIHHVIQPLNDIDDYETSFLNAILSLPVIISQEWLFQSLLRSRKKTLPYFDRCSIAVWLQPLIYVTEWTDNCH